ncbi:MAG: hypothetical protein KDD65_13930 [Bacteroidetes bacterium]|nr:hypothetical protein [Bacteroidota bacterium]
MTLLATGCDMFGEKSDPVTDEIFVAGRSDPQLLDEVEYVPLYPFFTRSASGGNFDAPSDVYVGFDEFVYVTDRRGVHVLESSGRPATFYPIDGGATAVVQDRLLNLYVVSRRDTLIDGRTWNLPAVLKVSGLPFGTPRIENIIWHPFSDDTRQRRSPEDADELVEFTDVGVLWDNSVYVSRRGPNNQSNSVLAPHNAILEFNQDGINTIRIPLNPTVANLRSAISPSAVATYVQPPQRESFAQEKHFILAQAPDNQQLQYSVLSIRAVVTTDGIEYRPDTDMLQQASIPDRGNGFLYDEFKFNDPSDIAIAGDNTQYIYVLDAAKDSLFVFTSNGIEGVAPPPGANSTIPVVVSFGGTGDGSNQFNNPQGVAYSNQIVYVADTGNNRISRFRLNTDFE